MKRQAIVGILSVLLFAVGCGGDGGVDSGKALSEVTLEEAKSLCEEAEGAISEEDATKVGCYIAAVLASQFDPEIDCQTTADECIANPEPFESECAAITQEELDSMPACAANVTVGEWQDCQLATARALTELADEISCTFDGSGFGEPPAECQAVAEKCPELVE